MVLVVCVQLVPHITPKTAHYNFSIYYVPLYWQFQIVYKFHNVLLIMTGNVQSRSFKQCYVSRQCSVLSWLFVVFYIFIHQRNNAKINKYYKVQTIIWLLFKRRDIINLQYNKTYRLLSCITGRYINEIHCLQQVHKHFI